MAQRQYGLTRGNAYHKDVVSFLGRKIDFIGKKNTIELIYLEFSVAYDLVTQGQLFQLEKTEQICGVNNGLT